MISSGKMIAMLPGDIRGRLRGTPENSELREMARMFIENTGDCCPARCFAEAVEAWVALGAPDPQPADPHCPHCGDRVTAANVTVGDTFETRSVWRCEHCDTWLGERWNTDENLRVQVHGYGHIAGM